MNLSKLFEKDEGNDFTTFPKTLDAYEGYKPVLIFIICGAVFLALSAAIGSVMGIKHTNPMDSFIFNILTALTVIPGLHIGTRLMYKIPFSTQIAPVRKWNWGLYFKSLIITLPIYAIVMGVQILTSGKSIVNNFTILTFLLCLILPLLQGFEEEYLCRIFLMQSFGSWIKIPILAIIIQAAVFASMHNYNLIAVTSVFGTGFAYGLLTWYGQGIEASSALHASNNIFVALALGLGLQGSAGGDGISDLLTIVLTVIPIVILIALDKKYDWGLKADVD